MNLVKSSRIYWRCRLNYFVPKLIFSNTPTWPHQLCPLANPPRSISVGIQAFTTASSRNSSQNGQSEARNAGASLKRTETQIESSVRAARQEYGDYLPEGLLSADEHNIYERLYGAPVGVTSKDGESNGLDLEGSDRAILGGATSDKLFREGKDGVLEEIEVVDDCFESRPSQAKDETGVRLEQDTLNSWNTEDYIHETNKEAVQFVEEHNEESADRSHLFTSASRSGANSSTLELPKQSFVNPITNILADVANKHIDEASNRVLGGPGLPYGTATPAISRTLPQKPIPLSSSHARMSEIEADVFIATIMPGIYAAISSILKEIRKRMGSTWIESLLNKEGGSRILDIGGGGAGVIAWREALTAEWNRIHSIDPLSLNNSEHTPLGKATVVIGSSALRHRSAILLENTTFLPRLPDYVHTHFESPNVHRKQFDIIIAPHSLWSLQEPWERKQRVLRLWNLLADDGGVLVLLEKGVPRGFEVIADSRQYLLDELFLDAQKEENRYTDPFGDSKKHQELSNSRRTPSRIIAPCPHTSPCPLYTVPGASPQRKDYCYFNQRFFRPPFYQRILGAKHRNHEDVDFSYIAVQKGRSLSADILHGQAATDRAFQGYDVEDEDLPFASSSSDASVSRQEEALVPSRTLPQDLPLPRTISTPLKRHGHVHLDLCTPSGTLERWTVPKSFGKQPYRDARKATWGDLWALGAKQREMKRIRVGKLRSASDTNNVDIKSRKKPSKVSSGEEIMSMLSGATGQKNKKKGRLEDRQRKREEEWQLLNDRNFTQGELM